MHKDLNKEQLRAIKEVGPLAVVAGPGTGKTKALIHRILELLDNDASAKEILAVTFTNRAASEIVERLKKEIPQNKIPKIGTFHAISLDILKTNNSQFEIIDTSKKQEVLSKISGQKDTRDLDHQISFYKITGVAPPSRELEVILHNYNNYLQENKLFDYDDLLIEANKIIDKQTAYKHLLIDEFQDTSPLQYEIAKKLAKSDDIFIIGDPNQSIYSFRGALAGSFAKFKKDFPKAKFISLITNYRSTPTIVSFSNDLFPGKLDLKTSSQKPAPQVKLITFPHYLAEAKFIISEIKTLTGGVDLNEASIIDEELSFTNIGVIYRIHQIGRNLEKFFAESGIPYQVIGSDSIYEEKEIKLLIEALRANEEDIGISKLITKLIKQLKLANTKNKLLIHKIQEFKNTALQFEKETDPKSAYLDYIDELKSRDYYDPKLNKVTLLTMHAAKGLEFDCVFLVGFEEGIVPFIKKGEQPDFEEERRLLYVGTTRAKKYLYLLNCQKRFGLERKISRYAQLIKDNPNLKIEKISPKKRKKSTQLGLF